MANEKRLIDANALTDSLEKWLSDAEVLCNAHVYNAIEDCLCEVDTMPTVDAVEVVHGRWYVTESIPTLEKTIECSACRCRRYYPKSLWRAIILTDFCPDCGAKMDGDGNG